MRWPSSAMRSAALPAKHVVAWIMASEDQETLGRNVELLEAVVSLCRRVKLLVASFEEGREPDKLDSLVFHVDRLYRLLLALANTSSTVLKAVGKSLSLLEELNRTQSTGRVCGYTPSVVLEDRRGRPKFDIKKEQLEYLLHLGFNCPRIADVLGVSLSTIRRRMSEFGLSITALYSTITDQELDALVSQIKVEFPNCGSRLMHGHLLCRGHQISQARIREALHRVDPEGVVIRWSAAVQRRKYAVASPLSLWHLDGNHKLIRLEKMCVWVASTPSSTYSGCSH